MVRMPHCATCFCACIPNIHTLDCASDVLRRQPTNHVAYMYVTRNAPSFETSHHHTVKPPALQLVGLASVC